MEQEFTPLDNDFTFKGAGKDYAPAPVKKLLKANIVGVDQTTQIDNFQKKPDGKPNPNYGKPQDMFVFKFKLNDPSAGEANGQVYTKWVSAAVSERSGLGKISDAVFGSPTGILEHKAGDLMGAPLQIALKPGTKDPERLVVDVDKLMPATDDQEKIDVTNDTKTNDIVLDDIPEEPISASELNEVFK